MTVKTMSMDELSPTEKYILIKQCLFIFFILDMHYPGIENDLIMAQDFRTKYRCEFQVRCFDSDNIMIEIITYIYIVQ